MMRTLNGTEWWGEFWSSIETPQTEDRVKPIRVEPLDKNYR